MHYSQYKKTLTLLMFRKGQFAELTEKFPYSKFKIMGDLEFFLKVWNDWFIHTL